jgi:hypothetical protein
VKDLKCKFCFPKRRDWGEDGFYGFQCSECKQNKTAFVVLDADHRNQLTPEEENRFDIIIEKHYPGLILKGVKNKSTISNHWYAFLVTPKIDGGT